MKGKKLPKRNSGMYEDENSFSKSGVKLSKQRRSKKPSIYDEMDELEELEFEGRDYGSIDDLYDDDEEFDDWVLNEIFKLKRQAVKPGLTACYIFTLTQY